MPEKPVNPPGICCNHNCIMNTKLNSHQTKKTRTLRFLCSIFKTAVSWRSRRATTARMSVKMGSRKENLRGKGFRPTTR